MTTRLRWTDANRSHRTALTKFRCTVDPRPKSAATGWQIQHPRKWEFDAQQWIRGLEPPSAQDSKFLRLGFDGEELGAVCLYEEVDGPGYVDIHVAAVALHLQDQGISREMTADVLDTITTRAIAAGLREVMVVGRIFVHNTPSQKMATRAGADRTNAYPTGAEEWSLRMLV